MKNSNISHFSNPDRHPECIRWGVCSFHGKPLSYRIFSNGDFGAYMEGKSIAVMPDVKAAIEKDMKYQDEKKHNIRYLDPREITTS